MPTQLALSFDAVPITCEVQQRYHSIAPCLAGVSTPAEQAQALNLGYSTITRWLREFREKGLPGLFSDFQYPREPYTLERVIVQLLYFKCCAPKAGDRELARVVHQVTGHRLDHHTVKALCDRFFFWRHPEFQQLVRYPVPTEPQALRLEMVRLSKQGWTEVHIAELLHASRKTVRKWLRRVHQQPALLETGQLPLANLPRAPRQPQRKVYFGAIHAVLTLQKKYGYAGWFRIKGYLERDYDIYLSPTTPICWCSNGRRICGTSAGIYSGSATICRGMMAWRTATKPLRKMTEWAVWELHERIKSERALVVLDVRQPQEWAEGHIEGALHATGAELPRRVDEVPKDRQIAVICGSGYRSSALSSVLAHHGHKKIANVLGGMSAWKRADLPTVSD